MLRRLWRRFGCIIHGHDLELKQHVLYMPFEKEQKSRWVVYLQCKHCGKVVIK